MRFNRAYELIEKRIAVERDWLVRPCMCCACCMQSAYASNLTCRLGRTACGQPPSPWWRSARTKSPWMPARATSDS